MSNKGPLGEPGSVSLFVPLPLVEHLEKLYPEKYPDIAGEPLNSLLVMQGKLEIIRLLRRMYEEQTKTEAPDLDPNETASWI